LRDRVIGMIGPDAELKEALRLEEEEKKKREEEELGRASRQSRRPRSSGGDSNGHAPSFTHVKGSNKHAGKDEKKKKKKKKPNEDDGIARDH
jgi:hypothetical protein